MPGDWRSTIKICTKLSDLHTNNKRVKLRAAAEFPSSWMLPLHPLPARVQVDLYRQLSCLPRLLDKSIFSTYLAPEGLCKQVYRILALAACDGKTFCPSYQQS